MAVFVTESNFHRSASVTTYDYLVKPLMVFREDLLSMPARDQIVIPDQAFH